MSRELTGGSFSRLAAFLEALTNLTHEHDVDIGEGYVYISYESDDGRRSRDYLGRLGSDEHGNYTVDFSS